MESEQQSARKIQIIENLEHLGIALELSFASNPKLENLNILVSHSAQITPEILDNPPDLLIIGDLPPTQDPIFRSNIEKQARGEDSRLRNTPIIYYAEVIPDDWDEERMKDDKIFFFEQPKLMDSDKFIDDILQIMGL